MSRKAVVLLSGGLDSSTCLLIAREEGYEVHALSFDYGQRHAVELDKARAVALRYGVAEHRVARIDFPAPVSPVRTPSPAPNSSASDSISTTFRISSAQSTRLGPVPKRRRRCFGKPVPNVKQVPTLAGHAFTRRTAQ